jgi:putative peptidoglycan lipid II flippase
MIMGASLILGSRAAGAVVAYQVGWVFFLAPYAILSQPIHTAVLPELVSEGHDEDLSRFRTTVRWAIERMALFVLPVTAGMVALSLPGMRLVSFGEVSGNGPGLLAAALASLAVGLLPYGGFLLLARAYYALGDSRTPGLVALAVGVIGVVAMAISTSVTHGAALAAAIGGSHTLAYTVGCVVLLRGVGRRTGAPIAPKGLARMAALSAAVGVGAWLASRPLLHEDPSRVKDLVLVAVVGAVGGAVVLVGYRLLDLPGSLTTRAEASL